MSFKDIKGQPFAVKLLKRAVESNRLATTYLFYGPEGVGKEFAAREFAKVLNCAEKTGDSCDMCSTCTRIGQNKHPDITWIYPAGKGRQIKIEQIRQLQKFVSMKAYEGKMKVCIIVDVHTLNIEAGNALLKTLEEPPPNSVLILVTHSPETLLPTITSRTQDVQFFYLSQDNIAGLLEKKMGFSTQEALFYSQLSMGSLGRALSLKNEDVFNQRKFILDILAKGSFKNMKDLMDTVGEIQEGLERFKEKLIDEMSKEEDEEGVPVNEPSPFRKGRDEDAFTPLEIRSAKGRTAVASGDLFLTGFIAGEYRRQAEEILGLILSWYRDILVYKNMHKETVVLNKDYIDRIKYWSDKLDIDELTKKIEVVGDIKEALARQVNLKLLLQVMFMELGLI